MAQHIAFPEIGQYRNLIRNVASHAQYVGKDENGDARYDPALPLPTLEFVGTVKLHGTNAAIAKNWSTNEIWFQSRERILTIESDNAGFVRHFDGKELNNLLATAAFGSPINGWLTEEDPALANSTVIYGEWCGAGIQKGVGISSLPKMFVIFAIRSHGRWLNKEAVSKVRDDSIGVYNIFDYHHQSLKIDFRCPIDYQNILSTLTTAVENECPVAKAFGKIGIGEGIVWTCTTPGWEDSKFWMKVKGEKHSSSKVKTLAAVDMEKVNSQKAFVELVVTESRCQQSVTKLKEAGKEAVRENMGEFLRWVYNDVVKEESDTAAANGIDLSKMGAPIATAAKTWFFKQEKTF